MNIRHLPYNIAEQGVPDPHGVGLARYRTPVAEDHVPVSLHGNLALLVINGSVQVQAPTIAVSVAAGGLVLAAAGNYLFTETPANGHYEAMQLYFSNELLTDFFIKYHGFLPGVAPAARRPLLAYAPSDFLQRYAPSVEQTATPAKLEALLHHLLHLDAARLRSWQIVAAQD
ncbi:hypothetical protein DCC81_08330 [Chitinophaga parva]|uniref:ExsA-like N-terminal regulatory domain-containing protein n=1 Tax=Chitinophaga parva TaxID=2169414 RepID=A0A2T7BP95_9BACT|nr:hypothetical protein [Chitinophaga parva]PUZ29441.1 hypothetical protein DCC81_08330 [Chitinophaga parva]